MATEKYYITNGQYYVGKNRKNKLITGVPVGRAVRFKYEAGNGILESLSNKYPDYCLQRYYSSSSKKNYVVTTANSFIGENGKIVNSFESAKSFRSASEAAAYISTHKGIVSKLINTFIINNKFETVNSLGEHVLVKEQCEKLPTNTAKTPRQKLTQDTRLLIYSRDNGICKICGRPLSFNDFTVDHIIPLNRGGTNSPENFRCVCKRCNTWKSDSLDNELLRMMTDVAGNYVYKNPNSDFVKHLARMMVRGVVNNIN